MTEPTVPHATPTLPEIPTRGARAYALTALGCALLAPWLYGAGVALGVLAMVLGSVAHLKQDRLGLPAAVIGGITTIVAMAVIFFTRT